MCAWRGGTVCRARVTTLYCIQWCTNARLLQMHAYREPTASCFLLPLCGVWRFLYALCLLALYSRSGIEQRTWCIFMVFYVKYVYVDNMHTKPGKKKNLCTTQITSRSIWRRVDGFNMWRDMLASSIIVK